MGRWGSWLATLAIMMGTSRVHAQGQGFMPPMPTPAPWGGAMPDGGPVPFGPSTSGGPSPEEAPHAKGKGLGPGIPPPKNMLSLPNHPNAWDDDTPADACDWCRYSSFTVDLLWLRTSFKQNPAYRTTQTTRNNAQFVAQDFDYGGTEIVPRLNLDIRIGDYWGIRGSWMRFEREAPTLFNFNSNANATVASPPLLDGSINVSQSDQIRIGNTFLKNVTNTFAERTAVQVISPRPFFFVNLVPRQSLLQPGQGTPLPPFTLRNAVQAGFPDLLTFTSSFRTEVADLELTRQIECSRASGIVGLGLRYGYISHTYGATRTNQGGSSIIPGYDPFISLVQDATIFTNVDRESVAYGHHFAGTGPKFSFELGTEITRFARLYSKTNASILFGNRKEIAFYESRQSVTITDTNLQGGQQQSDIFYNRVANPQVAARRDTFTVVPVGEAEAGIEIVMGGKLFPIFRVGAFGQAWINGGNATNPNANLFIYGINTSLGFGF